MEKEKENRGRDLKKNGSLSPSDFNKNCHGRGDGHSMESYKRERMKGLKRNSSDEKEKCGMDAKCNGGCVVGPKVEDGYIFRSPMNANGISSGKRIKLQGKLEVHGPVDPALVPRRLRSAMNKRISQSASPPLSDSKRAQRLASDGTLLSNNSSAERFKQKMIDEVSKDEKEVAEALTSLASLVTVSKPPKTKLYGSLLEENSETKILSAFPLEALKDEDTKFLVPCNDGTTSQPSHCVEDSREPTKADHSQMDQPSTSSISQRFDAEAKGHSQEDSLRKFSSNIRSMENLANLRDAMNSSTLGASLQYFPGDGMLQPTQLDSLIVQRQELGLWPSLPTSLEHSLQSFKQKPEHEANNKSQKVETATEVRPGFHDRSPEQLTISAINKTTNCPNPVTLSGKYGGRNVLAEKLPLASADKKHSWKKCATHVHISQLIRNFQKAEKKQPSTTQSNLLKAKEGPCSSMPAVGETTGSRSGMLPPPSSASLIERRMLEARSRILQDARMLQAQQAATLSGAYAAPQKQTCDLLSLSVAGDTKSSTNGMKSYSPNQTAMSFTFPQGLFNSQYQEQLTSGAAQQVQLQLPHYIASSQVYGPQVGQAAGGAAAKQLQQQQLMWQAHLAHYRPAAGFPPKWQPNGRQHDSSSSPLLSQPPSIFPLPADYSPHNLHHPFILPMPSSSSLSSRSRQQQHGGGLNPQSSSQVQMISSAEGFI